jgi:hypothetical protein
VRCPRCGNENLDSNRFCGMCGGSLLPAAVPVSIVDRVPAAGSPSPVSVMPSPVASGPATESSTTLLSAARSTQEPTNPLSSRSSTRVSNDPPVISGPSFLGLNDPGPRKAARVDNDPHGSPSVGNLDYLLEDEEEPQRGVRVKFVLMLLALALALGFGYLRWKNHGLPWLNADASKPATVQSPDGPDANSTLPPVSTTAPASSTPSAPTSSVAATPAAAKPVPESTAHSSAPATSSPATSPSAESAPANAAPATNVPPPSGDAANSVANPGATPAPTPKDKDADAPDSNSPPAASSKSNAPVEKPAPKLHAAIPRVAPADNVAEAQKYIYGRGVAQDCERGMRLLKPAANQSNPKAMVEMGALYSAGLCTPHDLPTAYRWFALALRKDPDNQAVQTDLQKLWGEMTQPERQLAIKLSQ